MASQHAAATSKTNGKVHRQSSRKFSRKVPHKPAKATAATLAATVDTLPAPTVEQPRRSSSPKRRPHLSTLDRTGRPGRPGRASARHRCAPHRSPPPRKSHRRPRRKSTHPQRAGHQPARIAFYHVGKQPPASPPCLSRSPPISEENGITAAYLSAIGSLHSVLERRSCLLTAGHVRRGCRRTPAGVPATWPKPNTPYRQTALRSCAGYHSAPRSHLTHAGQARHLHRHRPQVPGGRPARTLRRAARHRRLQRRACPGRRHPHRLLQTLLDARNAAHLAALAATRSRNETARELRRRPPALTVEVNSILRLTRGQPPRRL